MQFVLDYLTSILVGSVVLVILFVAQFGSKQKEVDQQTYLSSRRMSQAFALHLERDLFNIGYGVGPADEAITAWSPTSFAFRRKIHPHPDSAVVDVRYDRLLDHTITLDDGSTEPVYEIARFEDGVRVGGSTPGITDFTLEMLRQDGSVTTDRGEAVAVRVAFASVFGTRARDVISNQAFYQRTYYPVELND